MNNDKFIKKWKKIKMKGKVRYIISNDIMFGISWFVGGTVGMLIKGRPSSDLYSSFGYLIGGLIGGLISSFLSWNRYEEKYNTLLNENIDNTLLNEYIDDNLVNEAIQVCLTIGLMYNWNYSDKIYKKYGQKMLNEISEILAFINTIQPDLSKESFEEFLIRVINETHCKYPSLHEDSLKVLKNHVLYHWKPTSHYIY